MNAGPPEFPLCRHGIASTESLTIFVVIASVVPIAAAGQGLDDAFARLAQPEGEGWRIAESDILREWSVRGSPAMDPAAAAGRRPWTTGDARRPSAT